MLSILYHSAYHSLLAVYQCPAASVQSPAQRQYIDTSILLTVRCIGTLLAGGMYTPHIGHWVCIYLHTVYVGMILAGGSILYRVCRLVIGHEHATYLHRQTMHSIQYPRNRCIVRNLMHTAFFAVH